jgi:peptidoglycan L-alanyl-D-glutamate endopeptidase CwlK
MMPSARDLRRLAGVHPDLQKVVEGAMLRFDDAFADTPSFQLFVIQGLRTIAQQAEYIKIGASRTMKSRHLTGHAVDLGIQAEGAMRWEFSVYNNLWLRCVQPAALALEIPVEWGGVIFGPRFLDGPHFQLPWSSYPVPVYSPERKELAA